VGILDKIRTSISAEARLLATLATVAGDSQGLMERLRRHAARCRYAQMKPVLEEIADKEHQHHRSLGAILAEHRVWAKLPNRPVHEGSNDWERLSADLGLLSEIGMTLGKLASRWERTNAAVTDQLRTIAEEDAELGSTLRKLVLKCDPQALD
jgi:hypothetical protein